MDLFDTLGEKKLFIFDLDGTATDTEPFHYEAYRQTVEALCPGHTVTKEEFLQNYVGHPETEIYSLLKKNKNVAFDDGEFFRTRTENLFARVKKLGLRTAPFYRQLEILYPNAEFIALTSQRESVLERFRTLVDYGKMKRFISVADKPYSKADVLKNSKELLGYGARECVLFEDFAPTLRAAMTCGIYAVGVMHEFNKLSSDDCNALLDIHTPIGEGRFFPTDDLCDGEIRLRLIQTKPADPARHYLPAYKFNICKAETDTPMGVCDLRIGHNDNTYYGGNIGYTVFEEYRGHHYAAKACRLLLRLAKKHGMEHLTITCDPDNAPSYKTCEALGGRLLETAALPTYNDMYALGKRQVRVYSFDLLSD